jgi:hypothetical protein
MIIQPINYYLDNFQFEWLSPFVNLSILSLIFLSNYLIHFIDQHPHFSLIAILFGAFLSFYKR